MEILRTGEIDWMIEINKITGYTEEVIHLRGKYIPVIDFRSKNFMLRTNKPEILINVFKRNGKIMAFFISAMSEANC